jgi:hypothetical protein
LTQPSSIDSFSKKKANNNGRVRYFCFTTKCTLANTYLASAQSTKDLSIAMVLCHDTEVSLSQAKKTAKHAAVHTIRDRVAIAYIELVNVLDGHGKQDDAQTSYKKAEKLG